MKKITAARRAQLIKQLEKARAARKRMSRNPAKLERCVKAVKRKNKDVNPYAVCKAASNKKKKRRVRKVNPAPLLYIITAQGTGKKMHYDGTKFSERERVSTFPTVEAARKKAVELIIKYPVLRKYRVRIETNYTHPK